MSLFDSIQQYGEPTDHDLATLADWCDDMDKTLPDNDWKRTIAGLRKAADALIRRRARARVTLSNPHKPTLDTMHTSIEAGRASN